MKKTASLKPVNALGSLPVRAVLNSLLCLSLVTLAHAPVLAQEAEPESSEEQAPAESASTETQEPTLTPSTETVTDQEVESAVPVTNEDATHPDISAAPDEEETEKKARAANAKSLDESRLSNFNGFGEFNQPLLFAPEDNGFSLSNPQIKWAITNEAGVQKVNLGGLRFDSNSVRFLLNQSALATTEKSKNGRPLRRLQTHISLKWPSVLTTTGSISIETTQGKRVWGRTISEKDLATWKSAVANSKDPALRAHEAANWGLVEASRKQFDFFYKGGAFKLCLSKKVSKIEQLKICSAPIQVTANGPKLETAPLASTDTESAIYVDGKNHGPAGLLNFQPGKLIKLRVMFANRASVAIASQPVSLKILDAVESRNGEDIILTGQGDARPLGRSKVISRPETHFWARTGIQEEILWQIAIPNEAPTVRVLGTFNVPFTLLLRYDKLPKESDRMFIRNTPTGATYSSTPILYGYSLSDNQITSKEKTARHTDSRQFQWTFAAPKKGATNRARLIAQSSQKDGRNWTAHSVLYRGYPFEVSARLTGVLTTSGSTVVLGDVLGTAWFESLGFTQDPILSRQRWGLLARYFRNLTNVDVGNGESIDEFSVLNFDLKYNIVPGLWNRDELFGLILSTQQIKLGPLSASVGGVGAYWARSMPKVFDDLFNLLPFMRYPKYVDVEFILYPFAMSADTKAGTTYSLNFHGKVFWTERFFGEAGFGLKQFEFTDVPQESSLSFATAYGTVGLGFRF